MSCTPLASKNLRALFDTQVLLHGMPAWALHLYDYPEIRAHVMQVLYGRSPHDYVVYNRAADQNKSTRYVMSHEGREVTLRYFDLM